MDPLDVVGEEYNEDEEAAGLHSDEAISVSRAAAHSIINHSYLHPTPNPGSTPASPPQPHHFLVIQAGRRIR